MEHLSAGGKTATPPSASDLVALIVSCLDDDKADDIVEIDLHGKSSVADAMIVASGRSGRHVSALCDHLITTLKEAGHTNLRVEGGNNPDFDWVLIDAGDVLVHVFRPEVRSFYKLESLWSDDGPGDTAKRA